MTPQLQQAIRLLQLSTLDLLNEIQELLNSNPILVIHDETTYHNINNTEEYHVVHNTQS